MVVGSGAIASGAVGGLPLAIGGGTTDITIQDATHAHTADALTLVTDLLLTIADALHSQAADNVVLSLAGAENLIVQDATHSHAADNLGLTADAWLAIAESVHAHLADGVTLTTASVLAILESVHAHAAESLELFFSSFTEAQLQEILAYVEANMAVPTAEQIAAAVWESVLEGALTAEQMQRIMLAAMAGKRSGLGTAVEEYMAQDGITPRVTFTPSDGNGNGTTVVDGA